MVLRKARSTAQPLHIARRVIEMTEATQGNVIMVLLDWEQAFDKVDQSKLIEARIRLKIPGEVINTIKAIYKGPQFKVRDCNLESEYKKQEGGIRQGRPLSPYLFLLVMAVLFHDIHDIGPLIRFDKLDAFSYSEIFYADDTLLIVKSLEGAGRYVEHIITESA